MEAKGNELVSININNISSVQDEATAIKYANAVDDTKGFISCFRYQIRSKENGNRLYVFIDCEKEIIAFKGFFYTSLAIAFGGIVLIAGLIVIFSRIALRPVEESYYKQKRFITDARHELKTPLTVINANTELLEMENGANEWTESIKKQVGKLSKLTKNLVFLSRMDEGYVPQMQEFSLADALKKSVANFEVLASSKGLTFECKIDSDITFKGDESMIAQMFGLIIENAVKYSAEGKILISLSKSGKSIIFNEQNLCPMDAGEHKELFERFYRADSSRSSENGGHGIGLSVVKSIVDSYKGKISATGDGKSISFKIIF